MEIGFVSFNQDALNRANKVMKLLQGQGAIDELGLGRIRDAFSNDMFPGMSTLQTHAKYFLLMPALYAWLERTPISDTREARLKVRENEMALTGRLVEGSPEGTSGIIGADTLKSCAGYVKYDPAYVYQAGMETYGLVPRGGNIYATLVERSVVFRNAAKKQTGNDETGDDSDDLTGNRQVFRTCCENYDFRSRQPLNIALSYKEADFLKRQIELHTQGSLLCFLLESGLYEVATDYLFDDLDKCLWGNVPDRLLRTYILARRFSRFAFLLRLRYAMLYDVAVNALNAAEEVSAMFHRTLEEFADEFTPESIEEIVRYVSPKVSEVTCRTFIIKSADLIAEKNFDELDRLITLREKSIKGIKRSKLINAGDMQQGKPFEIQAMMTYRWNSIVRTVLKEIKEAL